MNDSSSPMQHNSRVEAKLSLDLGGALSKRLKTDRQYRPFKLALAAGTNSMAGREGRGLAADEFVVGIDSSEGKAILELVNAEQPWKWEGLNSFSGAGSMCA